MAVGRAAGRATADEVGAVVATCSTWLSVKGRPSHVVSCIGTADLEAPAPAESMGFAACVALANEASVEADGGGIAAACGDVATA